MQSIGPNYSAVAREFFSVILTPFCYKQYSLLQQYSSLDVTSRDISFRLYVFPAFQEFITSLEFISD